LIQGAYIGDFWTVILSPGRVRKSKYSKPDDDDDDDGDMMMMMMTMI